MSSDLIAGADDIYLDRQIARTRATIRLPMPNGPLHISGSWVPGDLQATRSLVLALANRLVLSAVERQLAREQFIDQQMELAAVRRQVDALRQLVASKDAELAKLRGEQS